jgi:osmotically inducible protein OsmC
MLTRKANAEWKGDLATGTGRLRTETGSFDGQYSFTSRFEEGTGTNPEELIAAAHAGCYAMALSAGLAKAGFKPASIKVADDVVLEKTAEGFTITKIVVHVSAQVDGLDAAKFLEFAEATKIGCPVSRALAGTSFELDAKLVS